jgi:serine/threonine-protein kinase TNNI3K
VSHNTIVALYGVAILTDNSYCMVMEYMSGGTLRSFIERFSHAINNDRRLGIVRRIADGTSSMAPAYFLGMNYLHSWKPEPILHRDLSTLNILVCFC